MDKGTIDVLTCVSTVLSAFALIGTVFVSWRVAQTQKLLTQRQLLIPLWEYMSKLDDIDPKDPKPKQVTDTVNALELVALCCEGGMVDAAVIKRTFSDAFIHLYELIGKLPEMPTLRRDGAALLRENQASAVFYEELKEEAKKRGMLKKVG